MAHVEPTISYVLLMIALAAIIAGAVLLDEAEASLGGFVAGFFAGAVVTAIARVYMDRRRF